MLLGKVFQAQQQRQHGHSHAQVSQISHRESSADATSAQESLSSATLLGEHAFFSRWTYRSKSSSGSSNSTLRASARPRSLVNSVRSHGSSSSYLDRVFRELSQCSPRELMALHYQYSFNARLILQATLRQLKYAREDLAELHTPDPSTVQAIVNETETLEQVSSFFFPRGYTQQADAFYVGFWTAWTEVRRVALARLSEVRWLRGIESIDVALEQVLRQMDFEEAIEAVQSLRLSLGYKSILTRSCRDYDPSSLAALQALDMSLSQNSLYNGFKTQRSSSLSSDDQPVPPRHAPPPVPRDRLAQAGLDQPYRPALRPFDVFSTEAPIPSGIPNRNDKLKSDSVPQGFNDSFTAVASAHLNASTSSHRKRTLSEARSNDSGESHSAGRRQRSPPAQMHLKDGVKVVERLKPRGARRFVLD